jgi:hypothetical protein
MKAVQPNISLQFPRVKDGVYDVALGNSNGFRVSVMRHECGLAVGIIGRGAYMFAAPPHPSYVAEKLRVDYADAENLADFIADQLDIPRDNARRNRFGQYCMNLIEQGAAA